MVKGRFSGIVGKGSSEVAELLDEELGSVDELEEDGVAEEVEGTTEPATEEEEELEAEGIG